MDPHHPPPIIVYSLIDKLLNPADWCHYVRLSLLIPEATGRHRPGLWVHFRTQPLSPPWVYPPQGRSHSRQVAATPEARVTFESVPTRSCTDSENQWWRCYAVGKYWFRWTRQGNPSYDDTDNARNLPQFGVQISQCLHETSEDYLRNTRTQRSTVLS